MYETVSPILYHSPIVQNLGLFLEGIQHPYESRSAPYHKIDLLSKVINLSIIHASSPDTIKSPRLAIVDDGAAPNPDVVDSFTGDRLGISDLRSWEPASSLWKSYHNTSNAHTIPTTLFKNLKAMSFGVWDDGRWSIYRDRELVFRQYCCRVKIVMEGGSSSFTERDQSWGRFRAGRDNQGRQLKDVYPANYIRVVLAQVLCIAPMSPPINICHHLGSGIDNRWAEVLNLRSNPPALRIIHAKDGYQLELPFLHGPTRVYIPIDTINGNFFESNVSWTMTNLIYEYDHCMENVGPGVDIYQCCIHNIDPEESICDRCIEDIDPEAGLDGGENAKCTARLDRSSLELCLVPVEPENIEQFQIAKRIKTTPEDHHASEYRSSLRNELYARNIDHSRIVTSRYQAIRFISGTCPSICRRWTLRAV